MQGLSSYANVVKAFWIEHKDEVPDGVSFFFFFFFFLNSVLHS